MLIDTADADGDGNIDYEEFGNMLFERTKKMSNRHHMVRGSQRRQSKAKISKFFSKEESGESREILQEISERGTMGTGPSVMTSLIAALGVLFITVNIVLVYMKD